MKTILAKTPHDSSFSLSKRYFTWKKKVKEDARDGDGDGDGNGEGREDEEKEILTRFNSSSTSARFTDLDGFFKTQPESETQKNKLKKPISKLRYALTVFNRNRVGYHTYTGLGNRVVGTLFGYRRGHVHLAVQDNPTRLPAILIELPMPTSVLVREMASGLVRIALECEKNIEMTSYYHRKKGSSKKLLEEATWRTYCNGKKCGFAARRDCTAKEWRVLTAVGPVTMGAGVLPAATTETGNGAAGSEMGELMYMRARFERVVGSRDSEAFYMMNPDGTTGGPELSVYFLRVL